MVFYDVDLRNGTLREFAFGTPWYVMPLIALAKLVRAPFQGSTDDPPVETLQPFEVEEAALPEEVRARFEPMAKELESLGFTLRTCHAIDYRLHATRTYFASFTRDDGRAWARLHYRTFTAGQVQRIVSFPMFFSRLDDGSFLVTSSGKQDMLMPDGVRMVNQIGTPAWDLWDRHNHELEAKLPHRPSPVNDADGLRDAMQQHHERMRDFNLARGVFQPLPAATQQQLAAPAAPPDASGDQAAPVFPLEDAPVHQALQRLHNARSTWRGTLGLLAVSLLLFVVAFSFMSFGGAEAGGFAGFRDRLWWIIPILAFHELGHYLAMRLFGYRNVRMFFIPFFGAAVSGKHYNVPGWKKAVVALSGPVPGILLGLVVGAAGLYYRQVDLQWLSGFLLILNGLQLLPLLPLDGGWVVHAVLFARHPVLEGVFRVFAAVTLLGLGILSRDYVVMILGGFMLLAVPAAWRMAAAADRLRRRGGVAASPDGHTIPPEAVTPILAELRGASKGQVLPDLMAQQVVGVYEMLNARPPGVLGSLALLAVHFGSLAAVVVLPIVAVVLLHWGPFGGRFRDREDEPPLAPPALAYNTGETADWRGSKASALPSDKRVTLVSHFGQLEAAREKFHALQKEVPPTASLRWFGRSVMLTLADDQPESRQQWKERLRPLADRIAEDGKAGPAMTRLHGTAPDEATAGRIRAELTGYLADVSQLRPMLLPPWSVAWRELPEKDRLRYEKGRRTMNRLQELSSAAWQAPEVQAFQKEMREGGFFRKPDEIRERLDKINQAIRTERKRLLDALRAGGGADLDLEVIDAWAAMTEATNVRPPEDKPAAEAAWKEQAKLRRQLAQRLGTYSLVGDGPAAGSNREAIAYGGYDRGQGVRIELEGIAFTEVAVGLPALAEWLARQGCAGLTYDVTSIDVDAKEDLENP